MSDHYGNVITHTRDNDTLLDLIMRVSFVPYRRRQRKFQLLRHLILSRYRANKIKNILCLQIFLKAYAYCIILQILNKTDRSTVAANVVVHARSVRVEEEAARVVAIVLSGRPIVAAVLHDVYVHI